MGLQTLRRWSITQRASTISTRSCCIRLHGLSHGTSLTPYHPLVPEG